MTRTQTTDEILEVIGINRQTLQAWVKKGCPCTKARGKGKQNKFDQFEVAAWMKANNLSGTVGRPTGPVSEQLAAAKLRKENAMAELHEIRVAREKGELVEKAEQERLNIKKFTVIRNKLMGLPAAAAPAIAGLEAPAIETALECRIRDLLAELSRA
jgi:terminase small subunit / prophage DNA-packing protein